MVQLEQKLPSLHTQQGYLSTSDKYQPISTAMVVEKLQAEGFYPTQAYQSVVRADDKKPFAKHMIRFRRYDLNYLDSEYFPEIVLVNSHDGLSSYRLMLGLYRLICSNGMVAGHDYEEVRIRHQGNVIENVLEGMFRVTSSCDKMMYAVKTMQFVSLSRDAQMYLAQKAHNLRFEGIMADAIKYEQLLSSRRLGDRGDDLFSVLNVIQENLIRGGLYGVYRNERGFLQSVRSRAVKSIDTDIRINRQLWSSAESLLAHVAT